MFSAIKLRIAADLRVMVGREIVIIGIDFYYIIGRDF